jgi:hypothetical protein
MNNRTIKIYYEGTSMEYIFEGSTYGAEKDLREFCKNAQINNWFAHISDMTGSLTMRG